MKKYKLEVQKIIDGYMIVYANDEEDALEGGREIISDREFTPEYTTWEVSRFDFPKEIDTNPNADLWR